MHGIVNRDINPSAIVQNIQEPIQELASKEGNQPSLETTNSKNKAVVLYDGACPLCQRSIAMIKKLDWFKALAYQDCRDKTRWPESKVPLVLKDMLTEMHLVTADRKKVYVGFKAFRWMCWRIPLTALFAPFLYIPGIPWLGNKVYLWVAKNRFNLVPCKDGVCHLPPKSK
jgi:predicted DCC family thiol-disulfide oxidoreductase YuxK